jgi:Methyltransferase domain
VVGAYHVATFPGWEAIVDAQCTRMKSSGLLDRSEEVLVGVVGNFDLARDRVRALLGEKARLTFGGPLSAYEFGTLELLYRAACAGREFLGWYVHTKGVSSGSEAAAAHRRRMESVIMDNHRACVDLLIDYNACGSGWQTTGFDKPNPHFSGNFWWARASYLRTLPQPTSLDTSDRYQAEFWIGKSPAIRPFELLSPSEPFSRPSAWVGLERKYRDLCEIDCPEEIRCVVDIGVDYGFTSFQLAKDFTGAQVIGVSDFSMHADSETWVRSHLHLFPNLRIIHGDTAAVGRSFGAPVDLVHVDWDHSYEAVRNDFEAWEPLVRLGGRILFHDTQSFPGVRKFFDELPGRKAEIYEHHGLGCWFKGT